MLVFMRGKQAREILNLNIFRISLYAHRTLFVFYFRDRVKIYSLSQDIMNFAHTLAFKFNLYLNLCEMCRRSLSNFFPNMRCGHGIYKLKFS